MAGGMIVKIRKYAILLLLVMLVSVPLTSFTIEAPDPARNVGISLFYKNGTQKVSGAQFDLYLVAQAGSDGWDLVDPFDNYSISLDGDMSGPSTVTPPTPLGPEAKLLGEIWTTALFPFTEMKLVVELTNTFAPFLNETV